MPDWAPAPDRGRGANVGVWCSPVALLDDPDAHAFEADAAIFASWNAMSPVCRARAST